MASAPLPAHVQAQLQKLEDALKAARAAGDAKAEAKTLNLIGALYVVTSNYPNALESYNQGLARARSQKDAEQEAAALNGIGDCYRSKNEFKKALDTYQQALDVTTASGDERGQAVSLNGLGWIESIIGQNQRSLEYHIRALPLARKAGDSVEEAAILRRTGVVCFLLGDTQKALDYVNQAILLSRRTGDDDGEATGLSYLGLGYSELRDQQKALEFYSQALALFREVGDRQMAAQVLNGLGLAYTRLGQSLKELESYTQALSMFRELGDRASEANDLNSLAYLYSQLGERQKALELYNQALSVFRKLGNRDAEANDLKNIGLLYSDLGQRDKALELFNQALPIFREMGDRKLEAEALSNMALVYSAMGDQQKALQFYRQALPVFRQLGDRNSEGIVLNGLGLVYSKIGEQQKALEYLNQALPILRQAGNRNMEATVLANIGFAYSGLDDQLKALELYSQALSVFRDLGYRASEATMLSNVGEAYSELGDLPKALEYFDQALPIQRDTGDRSAEGVTLNNIGLAHAHLGELQQALKYFNQALPILRQVGSRNLEATTLNNIGESYAKLGEGQRAGEYLTQALPLATAADDPLLECLILHNMMLNQRATQPALAIFYGKQAVNYLQKVRSNIRGLDQQVQSGFVASKGVYYHRLAELLIAQGRLPEAQQVLDLLKQQEYSDYVRGDPTKTLSPLTLTPAEQRAQQDYQKSTAQLVSLGEEWVQLKKIAARTPEQETRYQQLSDQLDSASKGLNDYFARVYVLFGSNSDANKQVADVKGEVSLLRQTIAKMPHIVALYTMVTDEGYKVIIITGATMVEREYAIPEKDLNQAVAAFQQALRQPSGDPKPLAQQLYKILIGPVKADLDQAHAQTLVWSLDGVLRYVPMAALYDGKQYLVENYNTVTITPVSIPHLAEKPDVSNLSTVAMGISQKYEGGLPPLPSVVGELDDIVNDAQVQGAHGVLPGTILLDGQFTEKAMEDKLSSPHGLVHIASHFVFKPGDDSQSYLLLAGKDQAGGGFHLTVADFRDNQKLALDDTDLLTLSACETGMGGDASNGREVDGLGTTAQLKGAKAVISSLWEVNDSSTGELMADFYQRWIAGMGKVQKVEALRQSQLDLLLGKALPKGDGSGRGFSTSEPERPAPAGYAHPYYWAPFVLMGNWR